MSTPLNFPSITAIHLFPKDPSCDWRAFVIATVDDETWELRAYGKTAQEAVNSAMERFADVDGWNAYGYLIENE